MSMKAALFTDDVNEMRNTFEHHQKQVDTSLNKRTPKRMAGKSFQFKS